MIRRYVHGAPQGQNSASWESVKAATLLRKREWASRNQEIISSGSLPGELPSMTASSHGRVPSPNTWFSYDRNTMPMWFTISRIVRDPGAGSASQSSGRTLCRFHKSECQCWVPNWSGDSSEDQQVDSPMGSPCRDADYSCFPPHVLMIPVVVTLEQGANMVDFADMVERVLDLQFDKATRFICLAPRRLA